MSAVGPTIIAACRQHRGSHLHDICACHDCRTSSNHGFRVCSILATACKARPTCVRPPGSLRAEASAVRQQQSAAHPFLDAGDVQLGPERLNLEGELCGRWRGDLRSAAPTRSPNGFQ
eukprot:Polyplicarium_translucidae@DN381_c0_g1_i1.p1